MLISLVNLLYYILVLLIVARIILSFTNLNPYHPVRRITFDLTEPLLAPVRRLLPPMAGLDFSPFIVVLAAQLLRSVLISLII
ncbi:MAG: YggT family protein [Chloroflexota bacterium]